MALPVNPSTQKDFRDDLGVSSAPWGVEDSTIIPVKAVGQGIPRGNNAQAFKTYAYNKTSAGGETFYIQVATVTPSTRIFYLGFQTDSLYNGFYIEDASTGNIAISDASTVVLAYEQANDIQGYLPYPRECKRGIRAAVTLGAGGASAGIIYYIEERTDGNLEGL